MRRLLTFLLFLSACSRGSGVPWQVAEIELSAGSELEIRANASMTGGSFEFKLRGPAKAHFDRDGTPSSNPKVATSPAP